VRIGDRGCIGKTALQVVYVEAIQRSGHPLEGAGVPIAVTVALNFGRIAGLGAVHLMYPNEAMIQLATDLGFDYSGEPQGLHDRRDQRQRDGLVSGHGLALVATEWSAFASKGTARHFRPRADKCHATGCSHVNTRADRVCDHHTNSFNFRTPI
jgi:hypothetical protein